MFVLGVYRVSWSVVGSGGVWGMMVVGVVGVGWGGGVGGGR